MSIARNSSQQRNPRVWRASDFEFLQELFRSNSGAVHKCKDKLSGRTFILKEKRQSELGPERNVLHEVELLEKCGSHENVIEIYGHFFDKPGGSLFMILELAEHGDLYHYLVKSGRKERPLSEAEVWKYFFAIVSGVAHLHKHGIVHRDLKLINILVSGDGVVKLGDLGIGKAVDQNDFMTTYSYGTPLYMSPEILKHRPYTAKTDVWALGVILYELCVMKPPFNGRSILELANAIQTAPIPKLPPAYSSKMQWLLEKLLHRNDGLRPSSADIVQWMEANVSELKAQSTPGADSKTAVPAPNDEERRGASAHVPPADANKDIHDSKKPSRAAADKDGKGGAVDGNANVHVHSDSKPPKPSIESMLKHQIIPDRPAVEAGMRVLRVERSESASSTKTERDRRLEERARQRRELRQELESQGPSAVEGGRNDGGKAPQAIHPLPSGRPARGVQDKAPLHPFGFGHVVRVQQRSPGREAPNARSRSHAARRSHSSSGAEVDKPASLVDQHKQKRSEDADGEFVQQLDRNRDPAARGGSSLFGPIPEEPVPEYIANPRERSKRFLRKREEEDEAEAEAESKAPSRAASAPSLSSRGGSRSILSWS